jgi:glycosyltransferase involved in cell wall biosynthesis
MFQGKSVAVVVPAYNEEGFVGDVIDSIPEFVDRLYVVDDESTDGTWYEIKRHVQKANLERRISPPQATVTNEGQSAVTSGERGTSDGGTTQWAYAICHDENSGVGGAIKTGYRRALEDGIDVTAVMNGDGQMDPAILDRIIEPIVEEEAAYSKGNRLISPELRREMSSWRFFGNSLLTFLTKVASGYWKVQDPQNGYTAISREALEKLHLEQLYDRYGFCNDILVKLNAHGLPIADVSMQAVYGDEESDIQYSRFVPKLSGLLVRNFLWRLKTKYLVLDFHPLVFFYLLGAVSLGGSLLPGLWLAAGGGSVVLFSTLALILFLIGGGFVLFAMIFDMSHNEGLENQYYA